MTLSRFLFHLSINKITSLKSALILDFFSLVCYNKNNYIFGNVFQYIAQNPHHFYMGKDFS